MISCKRDMIEPLKASISDAEEKSVSAENLTEQSPTAKDENLVPSDVVHGTNTVDLSRDDSCQLISLNDGGDCDTLYQHSICASQAQPTIYEGHINASAWEDYSQYMKFEGIDAGSTGVYNENQSLMFHTGYGYSPQMPYGPYSPVTTPLPSASTDGQLYSPHQFPFTGPYYQQPPPPSMPYVTPPTLTSQADLTVPVVHQGAFTAENSNPNSILFGPGYHNLYDSFGRDSFAGHSVNSGFYDVRQGFDSFGSGGFWSDWMKFPDGTGSLTPLSSPTASPQPVGAFGTFGQSISPISSGMGSQQQRPFYGFGSSVNPYDRGFFHSGMYHQGTNFGGSVPSLGANGRNLVAFDKGRRRGKVNASLCTCNGALDFLTEQNRGPRATRPKNANTEQHFSVDQKSGNAIVGPDRELYNTPDFVTEYKDAKFFIIKSYSEDNVHKSIKYGVWASTINGNRKLDSAYREAKESGLSCPVFLFFSVNASAQFCGVAEMIGTVDFERSVDFWQQDKWSGQFPVKWHIIKDVPNSLFRHILLENNDNKPVTNSRDTQEVILEQGLEMLSIFKKYESDMSILDDFDFYEDRQKAMQERKGRQQQQQSNISRVIPSVVDEQQNTASSLSDRVMNQISKSFVHVVQLEESNSVYSQTDKSVSVATAANEDATKPATSKIAQNS